MIFDLRIPESMAALPGRVHVCQNAGRAVRTCRVCGATKDGTLFYGSRLVCKACIRARSRAWEKANPERRRASKSAWDKAHRAQRNAYMRDWNKRRKQA